MGRRGEWSVVGGRRDGVEGGEEERGEREGKKVEGGGRRSLQGQCRADILPCNFHRLQS